LNKTNGDLAWNFAPEFSLTDDPNNYLATPILSNPIVDNSVVYISSKGNMYALDAQTDEIVSVVSIKLTDDGFFTFLLCILLALLGITLLLRTYIKIKRTK